MEPRRLGRTDLKVSPLCLGTMQFGSGKYRPDEALPNSARASGIQQRYMNERGFALLQKLDEVAGAYQATVAQVALVWLLARPGITAPIIGANSVEQLRELMPSADLRLDDATLADLDKASAWREK